MKNSQEANQPNPSDSKSSPSSIENKQDFFCFLKSKETFPRRPPSFFSKNGLSQDLIQVTNAEPDFPLEVFHALYHTLWPQIQRQSDVSFKDAWVSFIGGAIFKGILCPPEKLIGKKKPTDIKKILSQSEGEKLIFQELDRVISSISHLKQKIVDYHEELLQKEEIIKSLSLVEGFYQGYRDKVKTLGQSLIGASSVSEYETLQDTLADLLESKAVMMSDIWGNHWAYRIPRNKAQKLLSLDENGRPVKNDSNEPSNHRVTSLPEGPEPLAYFKANGNPPIQPEKEFMLSSLYKQLQIPVPETALLILTDAFENNSDPFYAVQASEAVIGESALEACQSPETIFEQEAYVSQVMGTLLTNPSDGSFQNFKYSSHYKTLVSIDNDLVFKPELAGENINVKSILYLLSQMDLVIPKSIKTFFTTLDPHLTILSWLKGLCQKNQEYNLLFTRLAFQKTRCIYQNLLPQSETPPLAICLQEKILVDPDLHHCDTFSPQILVSKNILSSLSEKLQIIEKTFLRNDLISTQILFEEVSPTLGKYYRKLRLKFLKPEEALDMLWGYEKNGINYSEIFSVLSKEEFDSLPEKKNDFSEDLFPEMFFNEYKNKLVCETTPPPLDKFIQYQSQRKRRNLFNLSQALEELCLLVQEGLTESQSPRDVVDFWHDISKMSGAEDHLIKEIKLTLSNLPGAELEWLFTLEKYFLRADNDVPENLRPSSLTVIGAFLKQRIFVLTEAQKLSLFDQQGNIRKNITLTGRSNVACFPEENPKFYLKQFPEFPGYEFASILFMRLMGITHLPYHDLMIIDSKHPVLVTQKVEGDPVFRVWQNPEALSNLDPFQTGLLIIGAILLNPEDGKEDNFILSPDGKYLIPIDNDHCFLPSTFQKGKFWNFFVNTALQTKTLLFCLDEMNEPIHHEVKQHILSINFDELLQSWLQELIKIEDRYNNLVGQDQRNAFLENGTVLRIPFYEQFIHNLYWKVNKIQHLLQSTTEQTPFSLLKAVEPFAARCYFQSFQNEKTIQNRFQAATKELYVDFKKETGGSRTSILDTRTMMNIINISEKDLQNDATYNKMGPADTLELLEQLIQERSKNRRMEQDLLCELDDKNEEGIWTTLFGDPLLETALKNFFLNPKDGLVLKGSKLITSSNLTNLFAQTPDQGAKIKFLSLPNSPLLDSKTMRMLVEGCPNVEYLNVSECVNLEEITSEKGEWPLMTRLEAKNCLNLKRLISSSPLKVLRVGTHQKIEILIEKFILNTFTISTQTKQFDFWIEKGDNFEIKPLEKTASLDNFLQSALLDQTLFDKYFRNPKITIGTNSILSPKDLGVFITSLDLRNHSLSPEEFREIVQLNLINLKSMQLPPLMTQGLKSFQTVGGFINNGFSPREFREIVEFEKLENLKSKQLAQLKTRGIEIFEDLIRGDWPQLTYLNLFQNELDNDRLAIFSQGKWPLLETLNVNIASISKKNLLNFVLSPNWIHLEKITHSQVQRSRTDFPNILLQRNGHLLIKLDLSSSQITQSEIETIVKRSKWPNLESLNLSNNEINDEGLVLLSQGNWPLLEILNLSYTNITNKGLLLFYLKLKWPAFRGMNLPSCVDPHLVFSLHRKKAFQVEKLELKNVEITSAEIELIVNGNKFRQLKYLTLSNNKIFDDGILILAQVEWALLEELHLQNSGISPKRIEILVNQSKWKKLKHLNLSANQFSDEGVSLLTLANWPLLEELNVQNTNITSKGIETIVSQSTWRQLKNLDISYNEILDEGILIFAQGEWPFLEELHLRNVKITQKGIGFLVTEMNLPNLKKLDISENIILDEGLKTLTLGKWPLFQHLVFYDTRVTLVGITSFLEIFQWPNLLHLEHFSSEFFESYNGNRPEIFLARAPRDEKTETILVTVLDITWLHSKEIYLSFRNQSFYAKILLLPRDKLRELESPKLSLHAPSIQLLMLPPTLKGLDISKNSLSDEKTLETLFFTKYPLLEELNFAKTNITTKCLETLIMQYDWLSLKKLCVSHNRLSDEGFQLLFSGKWSELENINLRNTNLTAKGIQSLVDTSKWPNLKTLDISDNFIFDKGLKILSSGKWDKLENLNLRNIGMTADGVESMISTSEWQNLKSLNVSGHFLYDEGLKILSSGKWPELENVNLINSTLTLKGIKQMVKISEIPNLKEIHLTNSTNSSENTAIRALISSKWPKAKLILYE